MNNKYNKLPNDYYSIELKNSYYVFHSFYGEPFLVSKVDYANFVQNGFQQPALINGVDLSEKTTLKCKTIIDDYIDNYNYPEVLDLIISEQCNLMCHMCSHALSLNVSDQSRLGTPSMSFDLAKKWIDHYVEVVKKNNLPVYSYHFGAAEPLLYKSQLWGIVEYIHSVSTDRKVECFLNSNLTLLDDKDIELLSKYNIRVAVGVDGLREQNDSIRVFRKNRGGTFNLIVEKIKRLLSANVQVGVNITLTDRNFEDVDPNEVLKYFSKIGIKTLLVDSDFINHINVSGEQIVNKLIEFENLSNEYDVEILGSWKTPYNMLNCKNSKTPKSFCYSTLGKNMTVTPRGNLTYCTYAATLLSNDQVNVEFTYAEYISNIKKIMHQCLPGKRDLCHGCPIEGLCAGGCQLAHEQNGEENKMCDIYLEAVYQLVINKYRNR
ncbi:MAG: radical SAM protein [Firmicutes bacterium]|nr:radical SAM protein [Bacillota bacterium]